MTRAFCDGDIILHERYHSNIGRDIINASQLLIAFPSDKHANTSTKVINSINYAKRQQKPVLYLFIKIVP